MVIAVFLFLSWFLFGLLATVPKKLSNRSLAFGILFTCFVNTNIAYSLMDPLHFVVLTHEIQGYVSYCLHQDIIIPALAVLSAISLEDRTRRAKWLFIAGIAALLIILELVSVKLRIVEYKKDWIVAAILAYRVILLALTIFLIRKISGVTQQA